MKKENNSQDHVILETVYKQYWSLDVSRFKEYCITAINGSRGKKETKVKFINILSQLGNKDHILKTVTNYFLSGLDLKVIA